MNNAAFTCRSYISRVLPPLLLILLQGCAIHHYQAEPVNIIETAQLIETWTIDNPELNRFLIAGGQPAESLQSHDFSLERLYLTGLYYHPKMHAALNRLQKAEVTAGYSGYRINPELSIPFEYHSDTSDDEPSPWTIGAVLGFVYERAGKREARQALAEVERLNARLAIDELAVDLYRQFREAYQEFLLSDASVNETQHELEVLEDLLKQLQNKFELGSVSQFEISSVKLEIQQLKFEHRLQINRREQFRDELLTMTQLPPHEFERIEISYLDPLDVARGLYANSNPDDVDMPAMQTSLLNRHLGLARRLNDYAVSEAQLKLEIEKQYPDIVLSPGFIFDQSDNIWTLGASWILPLFTNTERDLRIREAMEERRIRQQEIIVLQKQLLSRLYRVVNAVQRHARSIEVSDNIIDAVEQRAADLQQQIELGGIDRVEILRNRLEYFRARQTQLKIYNEAALAVLQLQQLLHDRHQSLDPVVAATHWIHTVNGKNNNEPAL